MKKILFPLALLLALLLTSCTNVPQEVTTTAQPEETTTEAPTTAVGSVVFQGERIDTPSEYAGVPKEYFPVLDDLYLYGELRHQYDLLQEKGEIPQEIREEYEAVDYSIRQSVYFSYPYGGLEDTGYALADLDGDKTPELLLLDKEVPRRRILDEQTKISGVQYPEICTI